VRTKKSTANNNTQQLKSQHYEPDTKQEFLLVNSPANFYGLNDRIQGETEIIVQHNESEYQSKIEQEIQLINQLVKNKAIPVATISELEKGIKSINMMILY
jgi:hemin uptake protein HemP